VGGALSLRFSTGSAKQVITVVAASTWSTTAVLQAWTAVGSGRWVRHGSAIFAHVGLQGLTTSPSESSFATPIGSFTLTTAFGSFGNPGTRLPYLRTTPADWWVTQSGPLYNTHQRCSSNCSFVTGWPNEHLYYQIPAYNYAVVIDYNTANTGKVTQGAGSAFFLHVTDGSATAGCVAIPLASLVSIMQWLNPANHPRILIGIG
jgi:L,D-peptidoglycan transpeptidase YkuD (ErfK/YbiS/YcfS/YnhG family)